MEFETPGERMVRLRAENRCMTCGEKQDVYLHSKPESGFVPLVCDACVRRAAENKRRAAREALDAAKRAKHAAPKAPACG